MEWKESKPSESQKRTKADIQKEYVDLCSLAGERQFQVTKLQAELYMINEQLFKLQEEFKLTGTTIKELRETGDFGDELTLKPKPKQMESSLGTI